MAKVFERIVYDQFVHHLNENNLVSRHQSGFRSLYSTVTALIDATDNWSLNINPCFVNPVFFKILRRPSIRWTTLFFVQNYKLMVFRVPLTKGSVLI